MCCAVWFAAPHSHDADCDCPILFMLLYVNPPQPVLILFRYTRCHTGLFDGVLMNYVNRQRMVPYLVSKVPSANASWSSHECHWLVDGEAHEKINWVLTA